MMYQEQTVTVENKSRKQSYSIHRRFEGARSAEQLIADLVKIHSN